jgi:hypothetical protein
MKGGLSEFCNRIMSSSSSSSNQRTQRPRLRRPRTGSPGESLSDQPRATAEPPDRHSRGEVHFTIVCRARGPQAACLTGLNSPGDFQLCGSSSEPRSREKRRGGSSLRGLTVRFNFLTILTPADYCPTYCLKESAYGGLFRRIGSFVYRWTESVGSG